MKKLNQKEYNALLFDCLKDILALLKAAGYTHNPKSEVRHDFQKVGKSVRDLAEKLQEIKPQLQDLLP